MFLCFVFCFFLVQFIGTKYENDNSSQLRYWTDFCGEVEHWSKYWVCKQLDPKIGKEMKNDEENKNDQSNGNTPNEASNDTILKRWTGLYSRFLCFCFALCFVCLFLCCRCVCRCSEQILMSI